MNNNNLSTTYRHARHILLSAITDIIILLVSFMAAFSVRGVMTPLESADGVRLILFSAGMTVGIFYSFGIYKNLWARTSGHGITLIINAVATSTIFTMIVNTAVRQQPLPYSIILIGNVLALGGFIAVRYRSRMISGLSWRWQAIWNRKFPKPKTRVLIIGAGQSGSELAVQLKHRSDKKYHVVGFVDDDPEKLGMYVEGCQILGGRQMIGRLVELHNIDLVAVAIHNIPGPDFRDILTQCESTKALIKVIPDTRALLNVRQNAGLLRDVQPEDLLGRSLITHHEDVDLSPVTNKVILVTGAAGSIGSELARQLPNYRPLKLILLDCNESGLYDLSIELKSHFPQAQLAYTLANITDQDALEAIFEKYHPQVVFHAAAYKHVPMLEEHPNEAIRVNIGGTRKLAELSRKYEVERFVLISTDKAVNPSSVMGASKRICELLIRAQSQQPENKTLYTSVRFGNVLGSRGSVVPTFNYQISQGGPITITDKEMSRYFMTIPEAVNLVIHAACLTNGKEIFLLKMGEEVRILDLAERMIRLRGLRPYQDIEIHFTGTRPGEKLHEQLYDGAAESATETVHPGIIQLNAANELMDSNLLLQWVGYLQKNGIDSKQAPLRQLLWNMTSSEKYAILGEDGPDEKNPVKTEAALKTSVTYSANGSKMPQSAAGSD
ncbi:MAG: polysaccharide biosynthesis protein [Anaerolineae bacterium]|nr:polysaccharide biosynthesis protein [Anaerolineae bacterium]